MKLNPLVKALHEVGLDVHLETSGAFSIKAEFDWITLSPKRWKHPLEESIQKADEFKIIVDKAPAIAEYSALLGSSTAVRIFGCNPSGPKSKISRYLMLLQNGSNIMGRHIVPAYKVTNTTQPMA